MVSPSAANPIRPPSATLAGSAPQPAVSVPEEEDQSIPIVKLAKTGFNYLASFFKPISIRGERYVVPYTSTPFPIDPYEALNAIDRRIGDFERIQRELPLAPATRTASASLLNPIPPPPIQEAAETDAQVAILKTHLTNLANLCALHWAAGIDVEDNMEEIIEMARKAAEAPKNNEVKPSLKEMVLRKYNPNPFRWLWVHFIFWLCGFRGLLEKSTHVITDAILKEMRMHLADALKATEEGGSHGNAVHNLIEDGIKFLRAYKQAVQDYGNQVRLINLNGAEIINPTLQDYKNVAIDKLFGKSVHQLCEEVSVALLDKVVPKIEYKEGASWLNPFMNRRLHSFLKENLPNWMEKTLEKTTQQTKPYKLPFIKAIIVTATEQLSDLKEATKNGKLNTPLGRFPGTTKLPEFVETLLSVLEYGQLPTGQFPTEVQIQNIARKQAERERARQDPLNTQVSPAIREEMERGQKLNQSIEESLVKSINIFLHYIAKPENTEKMFAKLFTLSNVLFVNPATPNEDPAAKIQREREEIEALNRSFLLLAGNVFEKVVEDAVQEEIRGIPAKKISAYAEEQFQARKTVAESFLRELKEKATALQQRIETITPTNLQLILRDLDELKETLKSFCYKENLPQRKKLLEALPPAQREAILRPLIPIYDQAGGLMEYVYELQEHVQTYYKESSQCSDYAQALIHFQTVRTQCETGGEEIRQLMALPNMASASARKEFTDRIEMIRTTLEDRRAKIETIQSRIGRFLSEAEMRTLQQFIAAVRVAEEKYRLFLHLQSLDQELRLFLRSGNRTLPTAMHERLALFPEGDRQLLSPLIGELRPGETIPEALALVQTRNRLTERMKTIQQRIVGELQGTYQAIAATLPQIELSIGHQNENNSRWLDTVAHQMKDVALEFGKEINKTERLTRDTKREEQYHLTADQFDNTFGLITGVASGAAAGLAATIFPVAGPLTMGFVATAIYSGSALLRHSVFIEKSAGKAEYGEILKDGVLGSIGAGGLSALMGPVWGAAAFSGLMTGSAARNAIPNASLGAEKMVMDRIMPIFLSAYEWIQHETLYKAAEKIALAQIGRSYAVRKIIPHA